jgi:predicted deacylase
VRTPWGDFAPDLAGRVRLEVEDHPRLHAQELTFEAWVAFSEPPVGAQVLAELSGARGCAWRFGLSRHLELELAWADEQGRRQRVASIQVVDLLRPGAWVHVAFAFRNHCHTGQPYIQDYSRAHLYCTPAGERFPRLVGRLRGFAQPQMAEWPARLFIGSDGEGRSPWRGAVAQAALTSRAKLANEFLTLGQRPSQQLHISGDFVAGSAFYPVEAGPNHVVVGCKPYTGSGNYWFYAHVQGCAKEPVRFDVLPVPGGAGMLMSMFVSYDGRRWHRLPDGHYLCDRGSPLPGVYSFTHQFERLPAWLCTSVPYTTEDIDALERDLGTSPFVEILTPSRSVEGRPIRLFKISDPSVPDRTKRTIYMQAGQHSPAEMAPGRALDRAARYLASDEPMAAQLRRGAVFLLVPIVNVDCGHHGGSGMNLNRVNTNRDWLRGEQPEVAGLKAFLDDWLARGQTLDLALDFHSGGAWKNHVSLAIDRTNAETAGPGWYDRQERFLSALEAHTGIGREDAHYGPFIAGTFAHALSTRSRVLALCIELSHMTHRDLSGATRPVTQEHLESLGPRLVAACAEWLARITHE